MQRITVPRDAVYIEESASVAGHEESRGPLGDKFDMCDESDTFLAKTWELAEGEMGRICLNLALKKAHLTPNDIDVLFAGDLQNQCVASSGGLSVMGIPYLGLYGACSTLGEGLISAATCMCADANISRTAVVTTSHNCAAERQFRLPIEYGGQRPPTAQWTATAGGAYIVSRSGYAKISAFMHGKMVDAGISDANNMGAAMAPAVCDSIVSYFEKSGDKPSDYDAIVTGDLAREGSEILRMLLSRHGISLHNHCDCGMLIYDYEKQDVHSGGSGCGCSASVLSAYFLPKLRSGEIRRMLMIPTGALMSVSSVQQGGSIVGIAPVLKLEGVVG